MGLIKESRRQRFRHIGLGTTGRAWKSLLLPAAILVALSCRSQDQPAAPPTNFVFIMSDDHGWQAVSAYGSSLIQTPNIDRIARDGIRFDRSFVTNSVCAPSRAVLLTGQYSHLNGQRDNTGEFDGSQTTFPKLLQQAGYFTALVGKWHLKSTPTGFDYWNILVDQGDYYNPTLIEMGKAREYPGYVTDIVTDIALERLRNRNPGQPFFLMLNHKAPHRNWMPNLPHLSLYAGESLPVPPTFHDDYATRSDAAREQDMRVESLFFSLDLKLQPGQYPKEVVSKTSSTYDAEAAWREAYSRLTESQRQVWDAHYEPENRSFAGAGLEGRELAEWKLQRYLKDYLRCVVSVDENVGRVLDYLDEAGLSENTVVVYTSDQGFFLGEHGWFDKRFMYEESLRMPLVMRYAREIPARSVSSAMVLNLDFAPTLLDYAGIAEPSEMQGRSLRGLARGETPADWRTSIYYHYYEFPAWHSVKKHYGVRTDRHKLIHFYDDIDAWELYDLENDPHELQNRYSDPDFAAIREQLRTELERLRQEFAVVD